MDDPENVSPGGAKISACEEDEACTVVACAICLSEIPASVAHSIEGPDYVHYFCGLDCLDVWERKSRETLEEPEQ
ncbi:MAG: DUF3330 domain-containing protein [Betaproteobacteria bacterium]|nr:DUF3330 domain-containing protein [Betaproteobacteria bacterium]